MDDELGRRARETISDPAAWPSFLAAALRVRRIDAVAATFLQQVVDGAFELRSTQALLEEIHLVLGPAAAAAALARAGIVACERAGVLTEEVVALGRAVSDAAAGASGPSLADLVSPVAKQGHCAGFDSPGKAVWSVVLAERTLGRRLANWSLEAAKRGLTSAGRAIRGRGKWRRLRQPLVEGLLDHVRRCRGLPGRVVVQVEHHAHRRPRRAPFTPDGCMHGAVPGNSSTRVVLEIAGRKRTLCARVRRCCVVDRASGVVERALTNVWAVAHGLVELGDIGPSDAQRAVEAALAAFDVPPGGWAPPQLESVALPEPVLVVGAAS